MNMNRAKRPASSPGQALGPEIQSLKVFQTLAKVYTTARDIDLPTIGKRKHFIRVDDLVFLIQKAFRPEGFRIPPHFRVVMNVVVAYCYVRALKNKMRRRTFSVQKLIETR